MVTLPVGAFPLPHLPGGTSFSFGPTGIDRVVITYPVDGVREHRDHGSWDATTVRNHATYRDTSLGIKHNRVTITDYGTSRLARIELTPSLVLGQDSNVLIAPDIVIRPLMRSAIDFVTELLGLAPTDSLDDARVTRLDLAQNLAFDNLNDIGEFMAAFGRHRPTYGGKATTVSEAGRIQSVKKGPKGRSVQLYDKYLESSDAAKGTIRWECRLGRDQLDRRNLSRLGLLDPATIDIARRDLWDWSGMNLDVVSPESAFDRLRKRVDSGDLARRTAEAVAGFVALGPTGLKRSTLRRRELALSALGVATSSGLDQENAEETTLRADYATGRVTRV